MQLSLLRCEGVRNLKSTQLNFHPAINIILGPNGSGKTSLLEAIHLLSLARSFKSKDLQSVITYQQPRLTCFGKIQHENQVFTVGVEKQRNSSVLCQLKGRSGVPITEFIGHLAINCITPDSFQLLTAGPEKRRRFLDLGVFHVEHRFITLSVRYKKILKQRNALLKQASFSASTQNLKYWDEQLVSVADELSRLRKEYFSEFSGIFSKILQEFLPNLSIDCRLYSGWAKGLTFADALKGALEQDLRLRTTSVGPHRADIRLFSSGFAVQNVLSRGQQKLLVCAMILAQSLVLLEKRNTRSIFLIDDLSSELDFINLRKVLDWLHGLKHQLFLTSVDAHVWQEIYQDISCNMFHVEHGVLTSGIPELI